MERRIFLSWASILSSASNQQFDAAPAVLGLAQVGAFARQPEHDQVGAEVVGDVDAAQRAVDGVLPAFGSLLV